MGVDLKLLPLIGKDYWAAHQIIELGKDYVLWEFIKALPQNEIPEPLTCYVATDSSGNICYGQVSENPYGEPITYVTAGHLYNIALPADSGWRNKAAWAYLAQMPSYWKICLYWH